MSSKIVMETARINSLNEYIDKTCDVSKLFGEEIGLFRLYRGQEKNWSLLPKIGRKKYMTDDIINKEDEIIKDFQRRSYPYLDFDPENKPWDLLALAQHHGLPTRLLDWTENPLAALWFAFREEKDNNGTDDTEKNAYRYVWVFCVEDKHIFKEKYTPIPVNEPKQTPYNQSFTKVFRPNHISNRITAQNGWFTVHKYVEKEDGGSFIPLKKHKKYHDKLLKLKIPENLRDDILKSLDKFGINDFSLFPDLAGLSKYLKWKNFEI